VSELLARVIELPEPKT